MQFPESWLREFCNPPLTTQELADTLTMAGLEVEATDPVAPSFSNVVVAEVLEVLPHPNADRLRVCSVNAGNSTLTIVCGAPNVRTGIRVPCALVGADLPPDGNGNPVKIRLGKLRGVESEGMLCSAAELGIRSDNSGLLELPLGAPVGASVRDYLGLDDTLFTLKLTPNLAHCLSVYGVARELAALTGAPLKQLEVQSVPPVLEDVLPVSVLASDLCGRFSGRLIKGIDCEKKTPDWMVARLERCGQRSVNVLVDISNYVMFECGQPTHIFDADRIHGGLTVRWARDGEQLKLLNGTMVSLDPHVGVIANEACVESLAGIMGGDSTAVSNATKSIYVEAAFWWPQAIAGRSRRYNFSTDAGHRFERGVDPSGTLSTLERITKLIVEICGGQVGPLTDVQPNMPKQKPVTLRVARASKVIGMPLTQTQCVNALRGLGLNVVEADGVLSVLPPPYRFDIQIEEDLIEEVARVIGYDNLPETPPRAPITAKLQPENRRGPFAIRHLLAQMGYQETINFSFTDRNWEAQFAGNSQPIELLNPIATHMSVMRSTLLGSLVNVAKFNLDRKADRVCAFEIGRVFLRDSSVEDTDTTVRGFHQPLRVAGIALGPKNGLTWEGGGGGRFDFFDVKGHVEQLIAPLCPEFQSAEHPAFHPGRCASVRLGGKLVGYVGELHPKWCQSWGIGVAPVLFELEMEALAERSVPVFETFSKIQAVERDVSVWVPDGVTHAQLMASIHATPIQPLLRDAKLFDIYRPKSGAGAEGSEKSLAIRLVLKRDDAVLTDQEIDAALDAVVRRLADQLGARQRA